MKKVANRWLTPLAVLLGLALSPVFFFLAAFGGFVLMPWLWRDNVGGFALLLTLLVPIVIGIGWSIFAAVGWRRGNVGIRIGLTAIVWAIVAGAEVNLLGRCILGSTH